jgi:hypothetical protein
MSVFVQVPLLGVIENMSRMEMPLLQLLETLQLGENKDAEKARAALIAAAKSSGFESSAVGVPLFAAADGPATCVSAMAERLGVEFLGAIPHDPNLLAASESGIRLADLAPHSAASAPLDVVLEGASKARVPVTVFLGHSRLPRLSDQTEERCSVGYPSLSFVVLALLRKLALADTESPSEQRSVTSEVAKIRAVAQVCLALTEHLHKMNSLSEKTPNPCACTCLSRLRRKIRSIRA